MKKNLFLTKLKKERKLEIVEISNEISNSYLQKADNCLKSSKLLLDNQLYENSITMSYYAMYDSLISLLYSIGIKSENHSASILMLKLIFEEKELFNIISNAKNQRIDKQYYVDSKKDNLTKDVAEKLYFDSEDFLLKIKTLINKLNNELIGNYKSKFKELTD